jgi:membrane fusion protein, copper/silver efflux system
VLRFRTSAAVRGPTCDICNLNICIRESGNRMNRIKVVVVLVAVLLAGAGLGYWFANHGASGKVARSDAASADAASAQQAKRKVLYWHDPMVPGQRFDKPGKSPFMDMQLVPVYADEETGGPAVRVSSNVTQSLGIRIGKVEKAVLKPRLAAVGNVAFDERSLTLVQARTEGYVTQLHVKSPLEHVTRGQPLADILSPQWVSAQEEYLALLDAQTERAQSIRDATRQRLTVIGVPEATIRAIEKDHKTRANTTVVAPTDGVVTELAVREGATFIAGALLFRINGLRTVWVNAEVPEAQVSMIPAGSSVVARATAWPGMSFTGRVVELLPDVNLETRTLPVRIVLENPERKLAPGMFVSLEFTGKAGEPQLVVPSEAVIMTGERNAVIVAREGGGFDVADVTVGTEVDGKTAILSGLTEGQSIVISGQFLIDSEASLRSTVTRLSGTAEAGAQSERTTDSTPGPAPSSHLTQGAVTAIAPDAITIAHEPVPSLQWPAMTMTFKAPAQGLPPGLKVGDRVSFSFAEVQPGSFEIQNITMLDEQRPAAPPPMHSPTEPRP